MSEHEGVLLREWVRHFLCYGFVIGYGTASSFYGVKVMNFVVSKWRIHVRGRSPPTPRRGLTGLGVRVRLRSVIDLVTISIIFVHKSPDVGFTRVKQRCRFRPFPKDSKGSGFFRVFIYYPPYHPSLTPRPRGQPFYIPLHSLGVGPKTSVTLTMSDTGGIGCLGVWIFRLLFLQPSGDVEVGPGSLVGLFLGSLYHQSQGGKSECQLWWGIGVSGGGRWTPTLLEGEGGIDRG